MFPLRRTQLLCDFLVHDSHMVARAPVLDVVIIERVVLDVGVIDTILNLITVTVAAVNMLTMVLRVTAVFLCHAITENVITYCRRFT